MSEGYMLPTFNVEECSLDEMLDHFLVMTMFTDESQGSFNNSPLVESCLKKVRSVCNNKDPEACAKHEVKVKGNFAIYSCSSGACGKCDDDMYPFTTVANVALAHLQEIDADIGDLQLLEDVSFHLLDPSSLRQYYQGKSLKREMNVIAASQSDARIACGSEKQIYGWADVLFTILIKPSNSQRGWHIVDSTVTHILVRQSARQQENAMAIADPDGPKRTSEHPFYSESQSKPRKSVLKNHGPVIVQAGINVTEMFSSHAGHQYVIGLSIIDEVRGVSWDLNPYVDPRFVPRPLSQKLTPWSDDAKETFCMDISMRMSKPDALKKVYKITENDPDEEGRASETWWYPSDDTSSEESRGHLCPGTQRLRSITELEGDEFLNAWWMTVKCHYTLWKNGVRPWDVSASNSRYCKDEQQKIVGVFHDFDLVEVQESAAGAQRTGTVPFMAIQLLSDAALEGKTLHAYEHDAESFIWILVWISLRYVNGKLRTFGIDPFDGWWSVGTLGGMNKSCFLNRFEAQDWLQIASAGHKENWKLAHECLLVLKGRRNAEKEKDIPLDADALFEQLLKVPSERYLK